MVYTIGLKNADSRSVQQPVEAEAGQEYDMKLCSMSEVHVMVSLLAMIEAGSSLESTHWSALMFSMSVLRRPVCIKESRLKRLSTSRALERTKTVRRRGR